MATLGSFTYNSPTKAFSVSPQNTAGNSGSATLTLAANNAITALSFGVANVATGGSGANVGTLHLGQVNTIYANDLRISPDKATGLLDFQAGLTSPSLTILRHGREVLPPRCSPARTAAMSPAARRPST